MKTFSLSFFALFVLLWSPARAADTYYLFKAAVAIPVIRIEPQANFTDKQIVKTLKSNDLINLALGRPLDTRITNEILTVAVPNASPGQVATPPPRLVIVTADTLDYIATVFDSSDGKAVYTVNGVKYAGQFLGALHILETTVGDPANNKFFATDITAAGSGKGVVDLMGVPIKVKLSLTSFTGSIHFIYSTASAPTGFDFDGIALKGKVASTGKLLRTIGL